MPQAITHTIPKISLVDTLRLHFDHNQLDLLPDLDLHMLQFRAEEAIAQWNKVSHGLMPWQVTWYYSLQKVVESIKKILATRYGCND